MRHNYRLILFAILAFRSVPAFAIEFDPCVTQQNDFDSTASALRGQTNAVVVKFASWNADPDLIPDEALAAYRAAVRDYAFGIWKDSPTGKGILESWQPLANDDAAKEKFIRFVYSKEVTSEVEKKLAQAVFKKDYAENLRTKLVTLASDTEKDIRDNKAQLDQACSPSLFSQFMRVTLGNAMLMVNGNFAASKNESGDIAKAVRAISGISITDILKNGLQGGENSELSKFNKMIDNVLEANGMGSSTVAGQILNAINPSKWSVTLPNAPNIKVDTTIRIDKGTPDNVVKNLTLGLVPKIPDLPRLPSIPKW